MPRLLGSYHKTPFNVWDSFALRDMRGGSVHLLGTEEKTAGDWSTNLHRTNVCARGRLVAHDQAAFIGNWYARTNVPVERACVHDGCCRRVTTRTVADVIRESLVEAWNAWTHATTVTMTMGTRPVRSLPLSDLLLRHEHQRWGTPPQRMLDHIGWKDSAGPSLPHLDHAAEEMFEAFNGSIGGWREIGHEEREKWRNAATAGWRQFAVQNPLICPVRQCMSVDIVSEPRALAALLEVMPTSVAPQSLVWVHIEGLAVNEWA